MNHSIIVEPGSYHCQNLGDVAMMQVAIARIRELWPSAEIQVVTGRPDLLAHFCPSVAPIPVSEPNAWLAGSNAIIRYGRRLPKKMSAPLQNLGIAIWQRYPRLANGLRAAKARLRSRNFVSSELFRERLKSASLLIVTGRGGLNDAFAESAVSLLNEIEAALDAGIPVIAFGQGIGPITDELLLKRSKTVLPRLPLIALREGRMGLPLLQSLGVPEENVFVTGDDAIELAYERRRPAPGCGIGINLRVARYAGSNDAIALKLRDCLRDLSKRTNRPLVEIPISFHASDSDVAAIEQLFGTRSAAMPEFNEGPLGIIRAIGDCRIVVTGSYHAGVFALGQGIPVVGLIGSDYYEQKFKGLEAQFPGGCRLLDLRAPLSSAEIEKVVLDSLESAETIRQSLLISATEQVELSRRAYRHVGELFPLDPRSVEKARKLRREPAEEIARKRPPIMKCRTPDGDAG